MFKKKKYLAFEDFSVFSYGPKPERKRFTTFNQHMFNIGVSLDGDLIAAHPELLDGWDDEAAPRRRRAFAAGPHPLAIVMHVYYEETWGDLAGVLRRLAVPFDLIVTTVAGRERLTETIRAEFPDAEIEVMENRGRDVRPFLALLERGRLDRYRYVCKVHGKKSSDGGRRSYMGSLWRRRLLFDLLAAPGLAQSIIGMFERDPSIGMIGPRAFRLPSETYSEELSWSINRDRVLQLAEAMGVPRDRFHLDFFGGTMFWVRPEALAPLRKLGLCVGVSGRERPARRRARTRDRTPVRRCGRCGGLSTGRQRRLQRLRRRRERGRSRRGTADRSRVIEKLARQRPDQRVPLARAISDVVLCPRSIGTRMTLPP